MVEVAAAGTISDVLIENLSFKFRPNANYVQERKSVTFYAQGSNYYSPDGTKVIKIAVTSDHWLDPSTLRVSFDVNNEAVDTTIGTVQHPALKNKLRPLSGGGSFFHRLRILSGGTLIEDISDYARCTEMFSTLINKSSKVNMDAEAFGLEPFNYKTAETEALFPGIDGGSSQTILFTPLAGILSQSKYIPLRYASLTFEFELVKNNDDPFVLNTIAPFTPNNTSNDWSLSNVQIKCDILVVDNELSNSYTKLLMGGSVLPINYSTYVPMYQTIANQQKVRLNIGRSLSRLKSVFVTLDRADATTAVYKSFNIFIVLC